MIYSNTLKQRYHNWPALERAIEALPTAKARGNVFEEFTFAYFTLKAQMYQISEVYTSADISDEYRKKYKLSLNALIHSVFAFICFLVFSNAFWRRKHRFLWL